MSGIFLSACRSAADSEKAQSASGSEHSDERPSLSKMLSFHYVGDSGMDETINQILQITNASPASVVPVLSFEALDKRHHVLPQVKVSTIYGSDQGKLVTPYGTSTDILRFAGLGKHDVADVRVTVRSTTSADIPAGMHEVTTQALDSHGRKITKFERFSAVEVTNEDDFPVSVRIAYILWDQPPKGVTQQAVEVTPIGDLTRVPAHGSAVVHVTGKAAAAVTRNSNGPAVSLKAYNSQ
ncbi:hypothetical protein FNH09_10015 [Streptomyces adustus]|uniref:Uncharacterized protein n=1 Tax=Streptomyces adustus TaxID=1609272 RepID=A0A5N8VC46_9ACTN|nr:hypothetical protein [Streptomyces adustus]MPY31604.1 hypothetical protein [Streptomyces adustus]